MSRRGDGPADDREELLAAHVSGGLDAGEAAEVEALLAESPDARAEADAIARLLAEVRAAEPRPVEEPDWGSVARAIQRACAEEGGEVPAEPASPGDRPGWAARLHPARWLAARRAIRWPVGVVGAAAVAAAILFLTRPSPTATTSPASPPGRAADARPAADARGSDPTATPAVEGPPAQRDAVEDGDGEPAEELAFDPLGSPSDAAESEALADLERALGGDLAEGSSFIADLLDDSSEEARDRADREAAEGGAQELALDDDPVDPFRAAGPSALDRLADELDDQDLEALDRFLAEVHAG
jgi:hypothetical protein